MTAFLPDLVETQDTLFTFLEGRQVPALTGRLLLLAGVTSALLAKASHDLGDAHAALTQSRTAFLGADSADHNGLRGWIRGLQSLITPLGNEAETLNAIRRAEMACERVEPDDVDELGRPLHIQHGSAELLHLRRSDLAARTSRGGRGPCQRSRACLRRHLRPALGLQQRRLAPPPSRTSQPYRRRQSFVDRDRDGAARMIEAAIAAAQQQPRVEYYLAVTPADTDQVIGFGRLAIGNNHAAKLGGAVHADRWGHRYASAMATALINFGFKDLGLHRITAAIGPENERSIHLVERASGFQL